MSILIDMQKGFPMLVLPVLLATTLSIAGGNASLAESSSTDSSTNETTKTTADASTISPADQAKKRALIVDIYSDTGTSDRIANSLQETANIIEKRLIRSLTAEYSKDPKVGPDQAAVKANADTAKIMKRFRELITEHQSDLVVNAQTTFNNVTDQNLTFDEVNYIASFYKSPTGKKSATLIPKSSETAVAVMRKALDPYVAKLKEESLTGKPAGTCTAEADANLQGISTGTQQRIKKMLDLGRFTSLMAESVKVEVDQSSKAVIPMIERDPSLNAEEKTEKIKAFKKFSELLTTRIDFAKVMEPYIIAEFAKNFTDEDLDNMIAYYEDPHSQTVLVKWPKLLSEAMTALSQSVEPKLQRLLDDSIAQTMPAQPHSAQ